MKIKNNLRLITITPILLFLGLVGYLLYNSFSEYQKIDNFQKKIDEIKVLKSLSINLARERGLSTLYTLSRQDNTKELLLKQRSRTDKAKELIYKYYSNHQASPIVKEKILNKLENIDEKRSKIDHFKLTYEQSFIYFDSIQSTIINRIKKILTFGTNQAEIEALKDSYLDSLQLIRSVSNERDYVTNMLTNYSSKNRLLLLHIFQDTDMVYKIKILDENTQNELLEILNDPTFINAIKDTQKIKKTLLENPNEKADAIEWFTKETQKIMGINKVANFIFGKFETLLEKEKNLAFTKMILSLVLLAFALYMLYIYKKLYHYLYSTEGVERVLNKIVDYALIEDTIDLDSTEGIEKTYQIIEQSVDQIEIEKSKAQKANAAKSIFLANMSHEIRTPINGIIGFTELLKKSKLPEQEREYVEIIDKSTESLLEIINNILDLSKIESKKVELDLMPFSPIEEFENTVEVYMPKIEEKGINLSLLMDPDFDNFLLGDIVKVKEVLLNLISNAVKFTPQNGQISVLIKNLPSEKKDIQKVYFEVSDSGVGISKEEMVDIFDAFSQADSTITRKYGGTGLGLTISSSYVALMGGKLEVSSKKNIGSNFYFTLEFKKEKPLKQSQKGNFPNFKVAIIQSRNRLLSKQIKNYFSYLGSNAKITNFENLAKDKEFKPNLVVAHFTSLSKQQYDFFKNQKRAVLIIFPTRYRGRLNRYQTKNIFTSYEPLTLTKFIKSLKRVADEYNIPYKQIDKPQSKTLLPKGDKIRRDILIAEDNVINQKLLKKICENFGLNVKTALNGKEAVEIFKKEPFDLIFMDIAMPVLDGVSATKEILQYEKEHNLAHTSIIAVTANALKGDRERFINSGLDDYIAKPVKENDIKETLLKHGITIDESMASSKESQPVDIQITENSEDKKTLKDLLIIKKSKVEAKIFEKVLKKSYKSVDAVYELDKFFELLSKNRYKVVMADKEISGLDLRVLIESVEDRDNTSLLLFRSFDTIIDDTMRSKFDEVLINSADETYLKLILENYI